jgi:signal peptidase II
MAAILSVILCLLLIGGDQFIKHLVVEYLKPIEYIDVIDGFLRFRYVENTGAVFGSFATHTVFLTIFSIVLLVFTIYFLVTNKSKSKLVNFCLLLMISGGVGNLIDRIRLQYVVDYIEPTFVNFAVFNFADCLITVGAFALILYLIVDLIKDVKNGNKSDEQTDDAILEEADKKQKRFNKKRKVKKAEVEGDKEAVVFNAVIAGKSPDDALNEMKMGIDEKTDIQKEDEAIKNRESDDDIGVVSLADKNTGISSEASEAIRKADDAVKNADRVLNATKNIENSVQTLKNKADELSTTVKSTESTVTPTENKVEKTVKESKSKKITIDSIDDIDFSIFK